MTSATLALAQARRSEMLHLFEANGGTLTPNELLAFAEANPGSALHGAFTWDDDAAAKKYRELEARHLITRSFTVIQIPGSQEEKRLRLTVSLPPDRGTQGYRLMEAVLQDPSQRDLLIRAALKELAAFKRKYDGLSELAEIFAAVEHINNHTAA